MARQEQPREDLLAEAVALVERVELALPEQAAPVTLGFRRDGCASIYFGLDPAYHFNTAGQLRRAYLDDRLLKAERGRLVALRRERQSGAVALERHELSAPEQSAVLEALEARLVGLATALQTKQATPLRQIPIGGDVARRFLRWFAGLSRPVGIAAAPHAR
jgi:hypothetical protein